MNGEGDAGTPYSWTCTSASPAAVGFCISKLGSTFTIDNTGWFGSNLTMPIINVPEVAILTMEAITKRAVVRETPEGDVIAIRPVMNMVLAIDHRANDGAQAAAFLRIIKTWLEGIGSETPIF